MNAHGPEEELPELHSNLVLIGGRGCGKSSLCRRILRRHKRFMLFPLDDMIRYEEKGRTIPEIVERYGWRHFREVEFQVAKKASAFDARALIDCGGGIVVDLDPSGEEIFSERKVKTLRRHSKVVYLQRDIDYLVGRIKGDTNRPSLSASHSFIEVMERREPWYRRAADHVLECGDLSKKELADHVLNWFYENQT